MHSKLARKIISGIGICSLAAGMFSGAFAPVSEAYAAGSFSDTKGHWAQYDISRAVDEGIVAGYENGNFKPDKKVSRAEFISMLNRALGNLGEVSISFSDVSPSDWYYHDVSRAVAANYASGFSDGTFLPNRTITRQEAAYMISMVVPTAEESNVLKSFSDIGSVSDWAYKSMAKIVSKGYIGGYSDNKLHPRDPLTRAQAATLIMKIFDNESIVPDEPVLKDDGDKLTGKIYPNDVTISKDLDEGSVTISNCVILGTLKVNGGGKDTVTISNSRVANMKIDKAASPVRVLAKGATTIVNTDAYKEFYLQSSNLEGGVFGGGFENVNLGGSSNATLHGSMGNINIKATGVSVNDDSGHIAQLTVTTAGAGAEITLEENAVIDTAYVNAAASFFGDGAIAKMYVNAKGVSYEKKPESLVIGTNGETPDSSSDTEGVTFSPEAGATDVYSNAVIIITFDSKMTNNKGKALAASKIKSIVSITKDSASGTAVKFAATMNTDATVFTITPSTVLEDDTKYYITVAAGTMMDSSGVLNKVMTSYFTTGSDAEKLSVSFYPATGATGVSLDQKTFTITFSEKITDVNGGTLAVDENSYLKKKAITLLKAGKAVDADDYTVLLSASRKVITIKLDNSLTLSTGYTVGLLAGTLRTESGTAIAAATSTWTSAGTPAASSLTATATDSKITVTAKSSVKGTVYVVALPSAATAPVAAAIKSGTGAIASGSLSVEAGVAGQTTLTGFDTQTAYKIYAVAYDTQGNASAVASASCTTMPLLLKSLTIAPAGGSNVFSAFTSTTTKYTDIIYVPYGTNSIRVTAAADKDAFAGTFKINGFSQSDITLPLTYGTLLPITVTLTETGKSLTTTYTVSVMEIGSAELQSIAINGTSYSVTGNTFTCPLITTTTEAITVNLTPKDTNAKVYLDGAKVTNGEDTPLTISTSVLSVPFVIYSVDGKNSSTYTINFTRP